MKQVPCYEGLDGQLYRDKYVCLAADATYTFRNLVDHCSDQSGIFNIDEFLQVINTEPETKKMLSALFVVPVVKAKKNATPDIIPEVETPITE